MEQNALGTRVKNELPILSPLSHVMNSGSPQGYQLGEKAIESDFLKMENRASGEWGGSNEGDQQCL